ncbi:MAG: hypothetical protein ACSHWS_10225 [Sulfitobacter sp.]
MSIFTNLRFLAFVAITAASPAYAADPMEQHNSNAFWFENWIGLSNATLKVSAPNGQLTEVFAASGTPVFELEGREVLDGAYRYELTAATEEKVKIINQVDNGRGDDQSETIAKPYNLNGVFFVSRGVIIKPAEEKEEGSDG